MADGVTAGEAGSVAVIGGGINGSGVAWELARRGYAVALYEKGRCGEATSSATTKMIHGGLRYLERLHFALVRESLRDRAWLVEHAPALVRPIEMLLPVYADSPRSRIIIRSGLILYDALAGRDGIKNHRSLSAAELAGRVPLMEKDLRGGFSYWDAQVDDAALVRSVVESAVRDGLTLHENTRVDSLRRDGDGWRVNGTRFDVVVNAAGPWMNELLGENGLRSRYVLSLVRGSHIVLGRAVSDAGLLLQSLGDRRVFFVLPWKGGTLVGTTEVVHRTSLEEVRASEDEIRYLIDRFNRYFRDPISEADIASTFAGVRPLVGRATNPSAIGRDYRITRHGNLINVFGGKMTTFMTLSRKVALRVDNYYGKPRQAKEPVFAI
ncbi:MAG TPA: glycerol-3-phosphate dehydrogenase/oxidase [Thermoanaerobaculia bacterium]|nr:glycerol-3-phosphate dehydrogenase/oxidase [Thermoanaerobaculia bacterium]